jgi:glutathione S-transferase
MQYCFAMKLLYQTHSPYARKVLVMAHEIALAPALDVIHHETSPTLRNEIVFAANPLGKVPVLICDDGLTLFDSIVICEYLDGLHSGPQLIPEARRDRFLALRLQAVAQGIVDAGIAARWETERRPAELRWKALAAGQHEKLLAAYDFLEREADLDGPLNIGQIALATALSWIEFRHLPSFKHERPRLTNWYGAFGNRPSMRATDYSGETHD